MAIDVDETAAAVLPDFEDFFRATFPQVAGAAALVTRDSGTGQELAQEAFFRLYERWSRMQTAEHARRFAFRVAINLARSHLRKHLRVSLAGLDPSVTRTDAGLSPSDDWLVIRDALGALSARQRAAVVLIDYVDMDALEAGEVLGISPATVRTHLMRGRRDLRRRLHLLPQEDQA